MNTEIQAMDVVVTPQYAAEHSNPSGDHYVFIYFITIRNRGDRPAQLMARHWLITDADGGQQEVRGAGVVGEQPVIAPGEEYSYNSFSVLKTTVGCMQGSYQMKADNGQMFELPIPVFTLAVPGTLQ